jgi:hypothetical protein
METFADQDGRQTVDQDGVLLDPHTLPDTYADALAVILATLQAKHPDLEGVLARAHAVLTQGRFYPSPGGTEAVVRSHDTQGDAQAYQVDGMAGTCTCPQGVHHPEEVCKHRYALRLHKLVTAELASRAETPRRAASPTEETLPIPSHYLGMIQGVKCIRLVGLIAIAHARGLRELRADFTYNDENLSLAHAVAIFSANQWFPDGGHFEESGDATPTNAYKIGEHWRRMALARAKARALRDALALDMVSVEEME